MKKTLKWMLVMVLAITLVACDKETKEEPKETAFTVNDQAGREVSFEKPAKTIVSGYYISTSTLIALGLEDALVGVEMKADTREIYKQAAPQLLDLPAMGNMKQFNLEECIKLKPDVVVLPVALSDYAKQLEEVGIACILVNPETQDSFEEMVELLGEVCGVEKRAETYLDYQEDLLDEYIEEESDTRLYFASNASYLEGATASMYQNELMMRAKGNNVLKDVEGGKWSTISLESLLQYDPEIIFFEMGGSLSVDGILNDSQLQNVSAIKTKQVYTFPSALETWDTPNPSSVLGVLYMYATLHPEELSMDTVEKEAIKFYKEFYDIEVAKGSLF